MQEARETDAPIFAFLNQMMHKLEGIDAKLEMHIADHARQFEKFAQDAFLEGNPHLHKLCHKQYEKTTEDGAKDGHSLKMKVTEVGLIAALAFGANAVWQEILKRVH